MDWNVILSVVVGGLFTLAGGGLQSYLGDKKRKEENKTQLKVNVLESLMGNRAALVDGADEGAY